MSVFFLKEDRKVKTDPVWGLLPVGREGHKEKV
jgi:hypothetical protein